MEKCCIDSIFNLLSNIEKYMESKGIEQVNIYELTELFKNECE